MQGVGDSVPASRNKVPPQHKLTSQIKKAVNKPKTRRLNKPPTKSPGTASETIQSKKHQDSKWVGGKKDYAVVHAPKGARFTHKQEAEPAPTSLLFYSSFSKPLDFLS